MGLISAKLRSIATKDNEAAFAFFCPGCKETHVIWYKSSRVQWDWNGDVDKPTVQPSYRVFHPAKTENGVAVPEITLCHCFIRDGNIQFLSDCAHKLAGQTVPIPDWPYAKGTYGGIDE